MPPNLDRDVTTLAPGEVVARIDELLEASYQSADLGNLQDVLCETVYIMLSKQTREPVYQRVFADLRRTFPTWVKLARARASTIERVVRPGGFGSQRASQLHELMRAVDRKNRELAVGPYAGGGGDLTLEFLREWPTEEAEAFLVEFPGDGLGSDDDKVTVPGDFGSTPKGITKLVASHARTLELAEPILRARSRI